MQVMPPLALPPGPGLLLELVVRLLELAQELRELVRELALVRELLQELVPEQVRKLQELEQVQGY